VFGRRALDARFGSTIGRSELCAEISVGGPIAFADEAIAQKANFVVAAV